jgi:hypothetical protein
MALSILLIVVLITFMVFVVSWHLKILFLYFMFLALKRYIKPKYKKVSARSAFVLFVVLFVAIFPNRKSDENNYIQSVYFNQNTNEEINTPILPFMTNIIGEGDIMSVVSLISKVIPGSLYIRSSAANDAVNYSKNVPFLKNNFHMQYRTLERKLPPPHTVPFQLLKGIGWYKNINHYYLHIPKEKTESTEVIVFCHGYTGNWLLYSELFAQYTDAIIIAVETPDFIGYFGKKTIYSILNNILPHAYTRIGLKNKKAHLIGLSNGGSAINNSIKYYPNSFKSYTILSASLNNSPAPLTMANIIYGANDRSGGVNGKISKSKYQKHVISNEDHSLLVSKPDVVMGIINQIIVRDN